MTAVKPRWAPKVPPHKIRRLYELDAQGLTDETLIDDVGLGLYLRCRSILTIVEMGEKRQVPCPACRSVITLGPDWVWEPAAMLRCAGCGWEMSWGAYWATFRHQELGAGGARDYFAEFVENWDRARTPRERLLLIDRLIHLWHWEEAERRPKFGLGRPTGVNLIEGSRRDVIAFLDGLTYGVNAPPELCATRDRWQAHWEEVKSGHEARRPSHNPEAESA